jgi:outer membrane lipoprotein SlyB
MSSALVLLLFLLLAAPALLAFVRRDLGWWTGGFYGAVAAGLLAWHVGFGMGEIPDAAAIAKARAGGPAVQGSRCEQILATAEQGRLVLDRRNPNRLVVSAALWTQLPEEVRTAISQCADTIRPADQRERPVEVVTR